MGEKEPEIVEPARGNVRYRVLPDEHFEFRGGGGAVSVPAGCALQDSAQVRLAREARLLPEHAQVYPCLIPDVWELAAVITEKVMAWRLQQQRGLLGSEVLNPQYFEFRDAPRPPRWLQTRSFKSRPPT